MERENIINKRMYEISKYAEVVEIILIALGVFLVPLIVPQLLGTIFGAKSWVAANSQYAAGTIVNSCLIIAGINTKGWKKIISIVTLPSLSNLASGLIFTTASIYTLYMIPAIWIGNFAIIYLYRYLYVNKKINYILASITGIFIKAAVIFGGFSLLTAISVIPRAGKIAAMLYTAMGMNQLITASAGSVLAFSIIKAVYRKSR